MKKEIKISEVINLLEEGKSREEIRQHFELSNADSTALFKHPALKGKRSKKQRDFVIIDDTVVLQEITNTVEIEGQIIQEIENDRY